MTILTILFLIISVILGAIIVEVFGKFESNVDHKFSLQKVLAIIFASFIVFLSL